MFNEHTKTLMTPNPADFKGVDNEELAKQLYDVLMAEIEPDLMLESIPTLDAKYQGETPEDHAKRMKRYEAAYKKFDAEFNAFMAEVNAEVRTTKRSALEAKEQAAQQNDSQALQSLESAFS